MYQQQHHLSINNVARPSYLLPFGLHVRSPLYTSSKPSTLTSHSFNILRVLDSSERSPDFNYVIGIELLVHLRYLAISCAQLPSVNLRKLEFIFVDNKREGEIPDILLNMESLRHVYFRGGACFSASCRQQANKDESLQINNLQTISTLHISDETDENFLRFSPNLRRLKCEVGSLHNPSFNFFNQLESLTLSGSGLTSLPFNLKKLTLKSVKMSLEQMEIIGRLLNLEVLKLQSASFDGNKWDTSEGEFPQLKFLKVHCVQIAEWNTSSDHFPRLQRLLLEHCHLLKMIPSSLGDIPTLQMIKVYGCAQAIVESASKIQEEQRDMGNEELKVMIVN
ncbi:Hypothetical predicted protein [Olea europaea subsp. europaea]|uniref:Disease resistance R13L4/SHOC-2-like LRR domain-containing protein n=1 Tax=Olea europaea subsp. europaea TaxID=158383 RepID=A0A8S0PY26_OLEEU|nr:Hypothetical predicted protein [Olea europaea subsp. europaea]